MNQLRGIYRQNLTLLTDLYQLTMAYGYWKTGQKDTEAAFNLFFRRSPFSGGYAVACGLQSIIDFIEGFRFDDTDLAYLAELRGNNGEPLFEDAFLEYLSELVFSCDVDAVSEGTLVFAHEPLVRVRGPLITAQLIETTLLNFFNFQTLVATKAARVVHAAQGDTVLEFGLRRAQGPDGGLLASRAAYVGGAGATSNVLAGKLFGIPVKGTHAHSWVMCFDDEFEAFERYADAMPNNCVFLVDTYDTLQGVRHAVEVGRKLRERGHEMVGIRLDSGDLAYLSKEARQILDKAGFPDAVIVASNDLDEHVIQSLKQQGATIAVWGVGTKLATAYDQPALGGVYKLAAVRRDYHDAGAQAGVDPNQGWEDKIKLSEQAIKVNNPGILNVWRYRADGLYMADMIYDERLGIPENPVMIDPLDMTRRRSFEAGLESEDLLRPIFRQGKCVYEPPSIEASRQRTLAQLEQFHGGIKRFANPHQYPVGLEKTLHQRKTELILKARGFHDTEAT